MNNCYCRSLSDRIRDVISSYNKPSSCLCPHPRPPRPPPRCPCPPPSYSKPCPPCPSIIRPRPPIKPCPYIYNPPRSCCTPCYPARSPPPCPIRRYIRPTPSREVITTSPCGRPNCPSRTAFITKRPSRQFTSRLNLRACPSRCLPYTPTACPNRNYDKTPCYEPPLQYLHDSPLCCPCPGGADSFNTTGLDMYNARLSRTLRCPSYEHERCPIPTCPPYQAGRSSNYGQPCKCPGTNSYTSVSSRIPGCVIGSQNCPLKNSCRSGVEDCPVMRGTEKASLYRPRSSSKTRKCPLYNRVSFAKQLSMKRYFAPSETSTPWQTCDSPLSGPNSNFDKTAAQKSAKVNRKMVQRIRELVAPVNNQTVRPRQAPSTTVSNHTIVHHNYVVATAVNTNPQLHLPVVTYTDTNIRPRHVAATSITGQSLRPNYIVGRTVHNKTTLPHHLPAATSIDKITRHHAPVTNQNNWHQQVVATSLKNQTIRHLHLPAATDINLTKRQQLPTVTLTNQSTRYQQVAATSATNEIIRSRHLPAATEISQTTRLHLPVATITNQNTLHQQVAATSATNETIWSRHLPAATEISQTTRPYVPVATVTNQNTLHQQVAATHANNRTNRHHLNNHTFRSHKKTTPTVSPASYCRNRKGAGEDFPARLSSVFNPALAEENTEPRHEGDWRTVSKKYGILDSSSEHSCVKPSFLQPPTQTYLQYSLSEENPIRVFDNDWKTTARKYGFPHLLSKQSKARICKKHQTQRHLPKSLIKEEPDHLPIFVCREKPEQVEATGDLPSHRNIHTLLSNQYTQTDFSDPALLRKAKNDSSTKQSNLGANQLHSKNLDKLVDPAASEVAEAKENISVKESPTLLHKSDSHQNGEGESSTNSLKTLFVSSSYLGSSFDKRRKGSLENELEVPMRDCVLDLVRAESFSSQSSQGTQYSIPNTEYLKRCKRSRCFETEFPLTESNCGIKLRFEAEYSLSDLVLPGLLSELEFVNNDNLETKCLEASQPPIVQKKQLTPPTSSPTLLLYKTNNQDTAVVKNCGIRLSAGADYCNYLETQLTGKISPQVRIPAPNRSYSASSRSNPSCLRDKGCDLKSADHKRPSVRFCVPCDEIPLKTTNQISPYKRSNVKDKTTGNLFHHTSSTSEVLAKIVCDCGNCAASRWLPRERKLHCQHLLNNIGSCLVPRIESKPEITYNHERIHIEANRFYPLSPHLIYSSEPTSPSSSSETGCFCDDCCKNRTKYVDTEKLRESTKCRTSNITFVDGEKLPSCFDSEENIETADCTPSGVTLSQEESEESDDSKEFESHQRKKRDFCDCGNCNQSLTPAQIPCTENINTLHGTVDWRDLKPAIPKVKKVEPENLTWKEVHIRPDILLRSQETGKRKSIPTWAKKYIRYRKLLPEWVTYRPVIRYWDSALYE